MLLKIVLAVSSVVFCGLVHAIDDRADIDPSDEVATSSEGSISARSSIACTSPQKTTDDTARTIFNSIHNFESKLFAAYGDS